MPARTGTTAAQAPQKTTAANNTRHQSIPRRDANAAVISRCRIVVAVVCAQTIRSSLFLVVVACTDSDACTPHAMHGRRSIGPASLSQQSSFHGMRLDFRSASADRRACFSFALNQPVTAVVIPPACPAAAWSPAGRLVATSSSRQSQRSAWRSCIHVVEHLSSMG